MYHTHTHTHTHTRMRSVGVYSNPGPSTGIDPLMQPKTV